MEEEFPNLEYDFRNNEREMPFWALNQYDYLRSRYIHNSGSFANYLQSDEYKNLKRNIKGLLNELSSDDYVSGVALYYDLRRENDVFDWFSVNRNSPTRANPRAGYIGEFFTPRPLSAIIRELELGGLTPVEIAAILNSLYELLQRKKQSNVRQPETPRQVETPRQPDNTSQIGDCTSCPIMGGKRKSFRRKHNKKSLKRRKSKRSLKYKR